MSESVFEIGWQSLNLSTSNLAHWNLIPSCDIIEHHITLIRVMTCCWNQTWHHDDVIKWKHFPRYWPFVRGIHRSPVNSPHNGQWRGALMFSLICVWINGWVNNRDAGDLRRYRAHYDVIVMISPMMTCRVAAYSPADSSTGNADGMNWTTEICSKRDILKLEKCNYFQKPTGFVGKRICWWRARGHPAAVAHCG